MNKKIFLIITVVLFISVVYSREIENSTTWVAYDFFKESRDTFLLLDADVAFRVMNLWGITHENALKYAEDTKDIIKFLNENGRKTSAMLGGISISSQDSELFKERAGARNPLGHLVYIDDKTLHGCYNRKEWQDFLNKLLDILASNKVDFVELDQPAQEHWRGECYCDVCINGFTEYLKKNGKSQQSNFNYVNYLHGIRLAHVNEGDREMYSPLGQDYWRYQIEKDNNNVKKLVDNFRKKHSGIKIFGNSWGLAGEYIPAVSSYDYIDIAGDLRTPWLWEPSHQLFGSPYNSWIPVVKMAQSLSDKKILSFLDTYPYERVLKDFKSEKDEILNIFAAEMLASGAEFVFPYSNRVAYNQYDEFSKRNIRNFLTFIKTNNDLFGKRNTDSDILVTAPQEKVITKRFFKQYWAVCYYLLDNGYDFDFKWSEKVTENDRKNYKIIINTANYSENIFRYADTKNIGFIKEIADLFNGYNKKITTDLKNARVFNYSNSSGENIFHIVNPSRNTGDEKWNITINNLKDISKVAFYPENLVYEIEKTSDSTIIKFNKTTTYVIVKQ